MLQGTFLEAKLIFYISVSQILDRITSWVSHMMQDDVTIGTELKQLK